MTWAGPKQGWDGVDEEQDKYGKGGGGAGGDNSLWDFYLKTGQNKRIMILDDLPFPFWEHGLWALTHNGGDKELCLKRNEIDPRGCPLCNTKVKSKDGKKEYNLFPHLIGYFRCIDMGDVVVENGQVFLEGYRKDDKVYQFQKRKLGAKRGSDDQPGMLKKIQGLATRWCRGSLAGSVWDVTKSGDKTEGIGDMWQFIEKIDKNDWKAYFVANGANQEFLDLEPVDWMEIFKAKPYEQLERLVASHQKGGYGRPAGQTVAPGESTRRPAATGFSSGGQASFQGTAPGMEPASDEFAPGDDDIPF